ncbi:MAG: hypothetical protein H6636_07125 [Anaerolineales bacterium]|nr:hypothetical protein [Anaerolineales bacterium]
MLQTFSCPNCGGTLEYTGDAAQTGVQTISCGYCGNLVAVPYEFWQPVEEAKNAMVMQQWTKYLIIFIVIVFVVPTCLGVVGTLLGIGGSIIGGIVAILASFLPFLFR